MEPIVDEPLGNIARFYSVLCLQAVTEDHLVHRACLVRKVVDAVQLLANVIRIENRVFRCLSQPIGPVSKDVSQGAHEHAKVAVERPHPPDRLRTVVLEPELAVGAGGQNRSGQKTFDELLAGGGAGAGTASAVGRGKRLVQVEMHHVDAKVTGASL